jgi:uncharacterized membrane protein YdcZ (DUF606 family)
MKAGFGYIFFPIFLGLCSVLQNTLNRHLSTKYGLAGIVGINGLVIALCGFAVAIFARFFSDKLSFALSSAGSSGFPAEWWFFIPGIFGFLVIFGLPAGISRLGTLQVFVGFVASQTVCAMLWDMVWEGIPLTPLRVVSAALSVLSIVCVSFG